MQRQKKNNKWWTIFLQNTLQKNDLNTIKAIKKHKKTLKKPKSKNIVNTKTL